MSDLRPLRAVVGSPQIRAGRGSILGPDTFRRTRWWEGELECGHSFERTARYRPNGSPRGGSRQRRASDVLPPPKRVRCDECPAGSP